MCHNREFEGTRDNFWLGIPVKGSEKEGINNYRMPTTGQVLWVVLYTVCWALTWYIQQCIQYLHLLLSPKLYRSQTVLIKVKSQILWLLAPKLSIGSSSHSQSSYWNWPTDPAWPNVNVVLSALILLWNSWLTCLLFLEHHSHTLVGDFAHLQLPLSEILSSDIPSLLQI